MSSPPSARLTSFSGTLTANAFRRRVVGITCSSDVIGDWQKPMDYVRTAYTQSCEKAGLLPILLPVTDDSSVREAQLDLIDGLLLSGGTDVHPRFYGADLAPETQAEDERRDAHEIALTQSAIARDLPIFAICRGLQVLNVALGGTLIQDLLTEVGSEWAHRQGPQSSEKTHHAHLVPGSRIRHIVGLDQLPINSHHHQAVKETAPGLAVTVRADDGVIEALEKPDARFVLGVQWHPENLYETDAPARKLFAAFAAALKKDTLC